MNELTEKLTEFIRTDGDRGSFNDLALELFDRQYAAIGAYRRLCESVGITPRNIINWKEIPAVPASAFRLFDLSCVPPEECPAVFYSSGTTSNAASKHWMSLQSLQLYESSLRAGFRKAMPEVLPIWAIMPSAADAPHSSLSHMLQTLAAVQFVGADIQYFADCLNDACYCGAPVIVFGTAFGLVELLNDRSIPLPAGSRVIETGGFKGRTKEFSRSEFYQLLQDRLFVSDDQCYSEYGMCEMASQFYSHGRDGFLRGPSWVRSLVVDPATGREAATGEPGLLRHFDLANLNSIAVLQTQDRAVAGPDGGFRLVGRASDAELRGCSLTAEELWSR